MTILEKIKIWGVKGAFNYVINRLRERHIENFFRENAKTHPQEKAEKGITVVGALSDQGSLNKTLRDFCFSLKDAGIPFQTWDLGSNNIPSEDIAPILTPRKDFRITRYSHLIEMVRSPVPDGIVNNRGRIVFWEFESGLLKGYPTLEERNGDIIGMSDFNYIYYTRVFSQKRDVYKILYPLRIANGTELSKNEARKRFNIPEDAFVAFYNFSYKSGLDRKNPESVMKAFAASIASHNDALLVFKTASAKEFPERVRQLRTLAANLGISNKVVFIDDYLTQKDVLSLTNACDVYISLHRAEGFGLGIAEAMSLGKPAIVTNYSSTTEFCNTSNSIPISFEIVTMPPSENKLYSAAEKWAEPNINDCAEALLKLYKNASLRTSLGLEAQKFILQQFSIENFKKSVEEYLSK
jgi:glycosyltransferase involved in cell wall biosynthesis